MSWPCVIIFYNKVLTKDENMTKKVIVAGVGMIPFKKPGASENYNVMGEKAA